MKKLPWGHRPDIIGIVENKEFTTDEKATMIYDKIKDYESRANDGFTKPMPCGIIDILNYLDGINEK